MLLRYHDAHQLDNRWSASEISQPTPGRDRLLLTGDAFTRGPDPLGVWRAIKAAGPEMVLGNHEIWLLPQLRAIAAGGPPDALEQMRVAPG